eukprot:CAMPEP_0203760368 /NCGR_PEP_ID=MMETSP0098-20131031/13675_1 /ASSEMBLY_ACC=CAM_ASM_000208 /TAXON_ID=96639 /ORGANISM=" , Strain NY0313808BC1" /LENGTH=130 /DNA_ID=CAMNT_0050653893 /DNA_START=718 /DNA_END=1107 /DNA_ORIENTATION=+
MKRDDLEREMMAKGHQSARAPPSFGIQHSASSSIPKFDPLYGPSQHMYFNGASQHENKLQAFHQSLPGLPYDSITPHSNDINFNITPVLSQKVEQVSGKRKHEALENFAGFSGFSQPSKRGQFSSGETHL